MRAHKRQTSGPCDEKEPVLLALSLVMHTSRRQCFDANNTRFKCCCGIHVKNGALLVSIVTFLTFGIILIDNINYYGNINNGSGNLWSSIAGLAIAGVVCALLLYGVCYARAAFLMPYLIIQGIAITVYTLGTIICFIGVVSDNQLAHDFADKWAYDNGDTSERGVSLIAFFVLLIQLLFQVWFFSVVYRCHVFFRLQCAHIQSQSRTVCYNPQAPPGYNTVYVNTAPVPGYNTLQVNTAPPPGYDPQQYQTGYMSQPPPPYAPQELEIVTPK